MQSLNAESESETRNREESFYGMIKILCLSKRRLVSLYTLNRKNR